MRIAYCDCFSGISGDMFLGALVDAGLSFDTLRQELAKLGLEHTYQLEVVETRKGTVRATQVKVDLVYLEDQGEVYGNRAGHNQPHRNLETITKLIRGSQLSDRVQEVSLAIFEKTAHAESRVHGVPLEKVHFHEIGAIDSIIDVVGAAIGLEVLGIERLYASAVPLGSGKMETMSHGTLPVPAPATLELLASVQAPTVNWPPHDELVTPTGAAILATLASFERPNMRLQRIGVGCGVRDLPWPNILRLWIGESDR